MAKVLVVDDDEQIRSLLVEALMGKQHDVISAVNGRECIEKCKNDAPDVVICDLVMPEKEGLETIKELHHSFPNLKIIAITGGIRDSAGDLLQIAAHLGAHRALAKPFSLKDLEAAIDSLLAH